MITKGKIIDLSNFPKHLLEQRFISVWLDLEVAAGDALIWMLLSVLYKLKHQDKIEMERICKTSPLDLYSLSGGTL